MTNKLWIDPPSGWRYGFPKIWDPQEHPDIKEWLVLSGYPKNEVDFGLQYYRQWVADAPEVQPEVPTIGEELDQKKRFTEVLENVQEAFQDWEDDFAKERLDFWNSLTKDEQLLAFCEVVSRLVQGELVDKRSYRGVLYDTFGFGLDSYVTAQISGFVDLHNAIDRK